MKFIKINIIIIFLFNLNENLISQEPVFTQFQNNPVYLNPALIGEYKLRFSSLMNSQWFKIPGQFNTQFFSIDGRVETKEFNNKFNIQKFKSLSSGYPVIGCSYLRNSEGNLNLNTDKFSIVLGYQLKMKLKSESILKFTFPMQFSAINKKIDFSNAVFMQNLNPVLGNINSNSFIAPSPNYNYQSFSSGFNLTFINNLIESSADYKFNLGFALSNIFLNELDGFIIQNTVDNRKLTFHATFFHKSLFNFFSRYSVFFQKQDVFKTFQATVDFTKPQFEIFNCGFSYRHQFLRPSSDNIPFETIYIIPSFLILRGDYPKRISFSYGYTLSELNNPEITGGVGEISFQLIFDKNNQWEFCPGDKGYRNDLNSKKKKIDKINNIKAKKRNN